MQGLTSRELAVLLQADPTYGLDAVQVDVEGVTCWELHVTSEGKKEFFLEAARGGIRRWKGLNWLSSFIQQTYPTVRCFRAILSQA